jgi:transcription elongation GreA/GreB family factor
MSRAFVKEPDGDQVHDDLPELRISEHPNYVTATGLQQLRDKRGGLLEKKRLLSNDEDNMSNKAALAQIERELRYVNARVNSAILVDPSLQDKSIVAIRATVKIIDNNDDIHRFTIVGEDEADIGEDKISWISPLAKVLLGKKVGDTVQWKRPSGDLFVKIDEIVYSQD